LKYRPPSSSWLKYKIDEAAKGTHLPSLAASGAIFQDKEIIVLGCFSVFLGVQSSIKVST